MYFSNTEERFQNCLGIIKANQPNAAASARLKVDVINSKAAADLTAALSSNTTLHQLTVNLNFF